MSALTEENDGDGLERDPADLIRDDSDSDQYQALRQIPTATATNRAEDIQKSPPPQHDDGYDTGSDIDDHTFDIGRHYFGAKRSFPANHSPASTRAARGIISWIPKSVHQIAI